MNPIDEIKVLHDVIQIKYNISRPINLQVLRDNKADAFIETGACFCKCKGCAKIFILLTKSHDARCPCCLEPCLEHWTTILVNIGTDYGLIQ